MRTDTVSSGCATQNNNRRLKAALASEQKRAAALEQRLGGSAHDGQPAAPAAFGGRSEQPSRCSTPLDGRPYSTAPSYSSLSPPPVSSPSPQPGARDGWRSPMLARYALARRSRHIVRAGDCSAGTGGVSRSARISPAAIVGSAANVTLSHRRRRGVTRARNRNTGRRIGSAVGG